MNQSINQCDSVVAW